MAFSSVEGLLQAAGQVPLWRAVLEDDLRERGVDEARSRRAVAGPGAASGPPAPASATPPSGGSASPTPPPLALLPRACFRRPSRDRALSVPPPLASIPH